jgi:hypothetical protein
MCLLRSARFPSSSTTTATAKKYYSKPRGSISIDQQLRIRILMAFQIKVDLCCPNMGCTSHCVVSREVTSRGSVLHEICENCSTPLSPSVFWYGTIGIVVERPIWKAFVGQGESMILQTVLDMANHASQLASDIALMLEHNKTLCVKASPMKLSH